MGIRGWKTCCVITSPLFISSSMRSAYQLKVSLSEASKCTWPIHPAPSLLWLANLEKKTAPHFLLHYLLGGSYFITHWHLLRQLVPRKGNLILFFSVGIACKGPHYPHGHGDASQMLNFLLALVPQRPRYPKRKLNRQSSSPTLAHKASTQQGHPFVAAASWPVPGSGGTPWLTKLSKSGKQQKQRILVLLKQIKGKCSLWPPTKTKTFTEKSPLLSCKKVKG